MLRDLAIFAATILMLAWCAAARAETLPTIYLDTTIGDDANPGTAALPIAGWGRAIELGCLNDSVALVFYDPGKPSPELALQMIRAKSDQAQEEVLGDIGGPALMTAYYIIQSRMANCRVYRVLVYADDGVGNRYIEDYDDVVEIY